jgi:hypothetical protein
MFNRNYSQLAQIFAANPNDILINHKHLHAAVVDDDDVNVDERTPGRNNLEIINCIHGWTYDKSIFARTVISEV